MRLLPNEILTEDRINQACCRFQDDSDLEIEYYQYLYVKIMKHVFEGCKVYTKGVHYYLHMDFFSLSDELAAEKRKSIQMTMNELEKDYLYPKSIDLVYLSHFSEERVQSLLEQMSKDVALVKDEQDKYILIGNRGDIVKAKKTLVKFESLICNQFFLPDPISQFIKKEGISELLVYSVIERMLDFRVQIHPRETLSLIKEKKRIKNIHPNTVNKEFVYQTDCPFNPSFHIVIEGKSVNSFIKRYPSSRRLVLVNPSLWKTMNFVEDDLSTWPGTSEDVVCTANPDSIEFLQKHLENTGFRVMTNNRYLEDMYKSINGLNRLTHVVTTEVDFISNNQLNIPILTSHFQQLLSLIDSVNDPITIVIPTLLPEENKELELQYLTQLFCLVLQKARSVQNVPDITLFFLVKNNKKIADYKASFEKLATSASFSISTKKDSIVVIGEKTIMTEVTPMLIGLFNELSCFSSQWNTALSQMHLVPSPAFSILSWNILAASYAKPQFWTHVAPQYLKPRYRRALTLQFLDSHHPSVFCLQECDEYFNFWKGAFTDLGYQTVYAPRTGTKRDGCCIAYDPSALDYQSHWILHYDDISSLAVMDEDRIGFRDNAINEVFEVDQGIQQRASTWNPVDVTKEKQFKMTDELKTKIATCQTYSVGLIVLFHDKRSQKPVIVATTHLFWNPDYYQIKLYQSMYLLKAIQIIQQQEGSDTPVFITMDSNSLPYSIVYDYYCLNNPFLSLRSAYETYYCNQEPLITNFSYDFIGCLDYIFYHAGSSFEKESVMDLPSPQLFKDVESLPSLTIPSDHLPIQLIGRIHSMKREAQDEGERPKLKTRAEMTYPFFRHVYCDSFDVCLITQQILNFQNKHT